jgi:uncharacterized protein
MTVEDGKREAGTEPTHGGGRRGPMRGLRWLALAAVLGVALVGATAVFGSSLVQVFRIKHGDRTIVVTGSAKKRIVSDRIVWKASIVSRAPELAGAYKKLAEDIPKILDFVKSRGVDAAAVVTSSVRIREIHPKDKEGQEIEETIAAYSVEQDVTVESEDVAKIAEVSRDATKLIEQGVQIQSEPPLYLYTKLADLKIEMLAEASRDARVRAEQIAANTGAKIARLQSARMGVTQVNAANETQVTGTGMNDTTSREKDVMAVVTATFGVD